MRSLAEHLASPSLGDRTDHVDPDAAVDGCAGGSCGVLASFLLDVDADGTITRCTARIRGRAAAFAAASAFCEAAEGRSITDAARLGLTTLHPSFAQLDESDRERALVVEDGFHHALGRWALARMHEAPSGTGAARPTLSPAIAPGPARPRVIVGMSGGVDSAVALHRAAHATDGAAIGATLRLWIDPRAPDPEAACCSPDSVRRARATCHAAGLPHLSIDLRESFTQAVVVPFVAEYATGSTPNPCVRCNGSFRLDELVRLADVLGAERVATGHYARLVERDGVVLLARGVDERKDQSYMLSRVEPATIARLMLPLGEDRKPAIRAEAAQLGLAQAETPESQEVCFLGGGDYRAFLARAGASGPAGDIVLRDPDGEERVVARHDGIARFTPGQRKGIGVAAPWPLYVLDVDPRSGRVLVGPDDGTLVRERVQVNHLAWHHPNPPKRVHVQLRYKARDGAVPARVVEQDEQDAAALLELEVGQRAPAPGQVAALYDDDGVVLGVARIVREGAVARARPGR